MDEKNGTEKKLAVLAEEDFHLPEIPVAFREALFRQTTAHVRARPRRRYMLMTAAVLLAYVGGLASMYLLPENNEGLLPSIEKTDAGAVVNASTLQQHTVSFDAEAMARRIAEAPDAEKQHLLRETGDYYVACGDYQRATRCYSRMLDLMENTRYDPDDTWLLTRLKEARTEETRHEVPQV